MTQTPVDPSTAIHSITQHCRQETDTAQLAKQLASGLEQFLQKYPQGHINISLEGDLGAGKTSFARHLIQSMGYRGKVKSPTYTLCEPYALELSQNSSNKISVTAHHFDLYRMRDPLEWQEAGFAEYFDNPGFCLIEWPEKAEGTLPAFDMRIQIGAGPTESERTITLIAFSANGNLIYKTISSAQQNVSKHT